MFVFEQGNNLRWEANYQLIRMNYRSLFFSSGRMEGSWLDYDCESQINFTQRERDELYYEFMQIS
jgi:hypothetical protein